MSPQASAPASEGAVRRLANFVGGQYVDSRDGGMSALVDPSTGEVFAKAPVSGPADVDAAFVSASSAFPQWRDATPSQRSLALLRIADSIDSPETEEQASEGIPA